MHRLNARLAILPVLILLALLFVGGPDQHDGRLYRELWQSGHFFLFLGLTYILLQWPWLKTRSVFFQIIFCVSFCISAGFLTEFFQLSVGRDFEYGDVVNDTIGGLAGFFLSQISRELRRKDNLFLLAVAGLFMLAGTRTFIYAVVDDIFMEKEFPVLAEGENWLELKRWDVLSADISLSSDHFREGQHSIKVEFFPNDYPDITLQSFIQDWHRYGQLHFQIYNPSSNSIALNLKIYDEKHPQSHYQFDDRFNRELKINQGWNEFTVPLSEVADAPKSRQLDLRHVLSFSLFMENPKNIITLYLDQLELTK